MKIKIFKSLDLDRKIMNIKHLRNATGLSLKESKDIVDDLFKKPSKHGIEVYVKDNFNDWDEFAEWFEYEQDDGTRSKGTLKLFRVIITDDDGSYMSVVLSTTKERAIIESTDDVNENFEVTLSQLPVITCEEITSFKNGQVLLTSQL